jgi:hypothetical protein
MNAEHRHDLERNELAAGVQTFVQRAKSGTLVSPRVLGLVVAAVLILGLWWYLASSGKSAASAQWRDLESVSSKAGFDDYAKAHANTAAGRIARLQLARIQIGPDGFAKLNNRSAEVRGKAIDSVVAAKDELVKLADEFKGDPTLRAQCLDLAAKAELALVGVPKAAGSTEYKGSVEMAVAHLKTLAETVGKDTAAGKAATERAADLEKNREKVVDLGRELESLLTPPPLAPTIISPGGLGSPTAPPATNPNLTLPGNVTPAPAPPPATPPGPTTVPPAAAAAGGAATSTPPTKK